MLSTNEKAKVGMINLEPYNREGHKLELIHYVTNGDGLSPQHLYILSDDEIKEGDWCIELGFNRIFQVEKESLTKDYIKNCKKIIATTNTSLGLSDVGKAGYFIDEFHPILPQPSQSFIEKYVTEYNKGNVITDVLVEYEAIGNWRHAAFVHTQDIPKVSKNNTITIKKVKDSWTRKEVIEFAEKYARMVQEKPIQLNGYKRIHNHKWIEENL